jgi:4-hydroxy-tetrahydrodipicolinate synthase
MMKGWEGVVPAMITPLTEGGRRVDTGALNRYCEFLADSKVHGVFCCGTTGEGPLLSPEERMKVAEVTVSVLKGRVRVVVQTGSITTDQTISLTRHARDIGADAAGLVLPYYYTFNDEVLYAHFMEVAEAVQGFPLFLYNIPGCTTNDVSMSLLSRLLERIDSIVGIKNSTEDLFQTTGFIRLAGERCAVFNGNDGIILPALSVGARGLVSGNASAFPELFLELFGAFQSADLEKARKLQQRIDTLRQVLANGRDNASFKRALGLRGIPVGNVRRPDRDLNDEETARLKNELEKLGFLSGSR